MKDSAQYRLAKYLMKRPFEKVAKGTLEDLARQHLGVTGETCGRRLRILHEATCVHEARRKTAEHQEAFKLAEGGKFQVENRDKNHCWYWYEPPAIKTVREVVVEGGVAREVIRTVSTSV